MGAPAPGNDSSNTPPRSGRQKGRAQGPPAAQDVKGVVAPLASSMLLRQLLVHRQGLQRGEATDNAIALAEKLGFLSYMASTSCSQTFPQATSTRHLLGSSVFLVQKLVFLLYTVTKVSNTSIVNPRACLGIATLAQRHTDYSFFTTFGLKGSLRHLDFTAGLIPCLRAEAEGERQRLAHHYPLSSAICVYFDTTHFLASPSFSWCRTFDGDSEASASIWANATLSGWTGSPLDRSLLCCIDGFPDSGHRQNVGHHWCAWIFLPVAVALAGCHLPQGWRVFSDGLFFILWPGSARPCWFVRLFFGFFPPGVLGDGGTRLACVRLLAPLEVRSTLDIVPFFPPARCEVTVSGAAGHNRGGVVERRLLARTQGRTVDCACNIPPPSTVAVWLQVSCVSRRGGQSPRHHGRTERQTPCEGHGGRECRRVSRHGAREGVQGAQKHEKKPTPGRER